MKRDFVMRNNVKVFGWGAAPMLFARGLGRDDTVWQGLTPAFEHDYRVVLFDYVDAESPPPTTADAGGLDRYARHLLEVCEALELKRVALIAQDESVAIGSRALSLDPARFDRAVFLLGDAPGSAPTPAGGDDARFAPPADDVLGALAVPTLVLRPGSDATLAAPAAASARIREFLAPPAPRTRRPSV